MRKLAAEGVGDHEAEDRIAEELERLVVDDPAARIFVRFRLVRQGVLEHPAIAEPVADARFERDELLRQWHDNPRANLFAMALDDAHRLLGLVLADRDDAFRPSG